MAKQLDAQRDRETALQAQLEAAQQILGSELQVRRQAVGVQKNLHEAVGSQQARVVALQRAVGAARKEVRTHKPWAAPQYPAPAAQASQTPHQPSLRACYDA